MLLLNHYKKLLTALVFYNIVIPSVCSASFWSSWSKKQRTLALTSASALGLSTLGYCMYTYYQEFALKRALHNDNEDAALYALQHISKKHIPSMHLLYDAVEKEWIKVTHYCLDSGADVNEKQKWHMTPLHCASAQENAHNVKLLLEYNADGNAIDSFHQTPLHYACTKKNLDSVKILLHHGADFNALNNQGASALDIARVNMCRNIVNYCTQLHREQLTIDLNCNIQQVSPELLLRFIARKTHQDCVLAQFPQQTLPIQKTLLKHALLHHEDMFIKLCYCNNSTISLQNIQDNTYLRAKYRKLPIIQNTTWWNTATASLANVTFVFES